MNDQLGFAGASLAVYLQLWFARDLVADHRLLWERAGTARAVLAPARSPRIAQPQ